MRIAYLVHQYPKVSHTFVRREIAALEARGVEVHRFALSRMDEPLADPVDQAEEKKTRVAMDGGAKGLAAAMSRVAARRPSGFARASAMAARIGHKSERGLAVHGAYLGEACVLLEWMQEAGVEHVHAHFGTNPATVAMLIEALGGPGYSLQIHGPEEFDKPDLIALGEKVERARFVGAISSYCRSQLYRRVSYEHWPKINIVRCGVDPEFMTPDEGPFPEVPQLVSVGRLNEQKGQILMVEALGQLHAEGLDFQLVLVGDGEMRPQVEEAIVRHRLGDKVRITGWASGPEVREHICASRAMVLPSFAEGLPVVIMEALGLERPVLSTYVAGIPELVKQEGSGPDANGWLIPAGSVEALVEALRAVLSTPTDTMVALGKAGRRAVLERHDINVTAAALHALLLQHVA